MIYESSIKDTEQLITIPRTQYLQMLDDSIKQNALEDAGAVAFIESIRDNGLRADLSPIGDDREFFLDYLLRIEERFISEASEVLRKVEDASIGDAPNGAFDYSTGLPL